MGAPYFGQLKVLLWRNYLLKRRNMKQLSQEVLYPLFYVGILIMVKALIKPETKPAVSFPENSLSNFTINPSQSLFVASNGLSIASVMTRITSKFPGLTYQEYTSETEALNAYSVNKSDSAVGIIFGYSNSSSLQHYAIRMKNSLVPDSKSILAVNRGECRNSPSTSTVYCTGNRYLTSGFANLQKVIDQALMEEMGLTVPNLDVNVQMMPKDKYTADVNYIQTISSIYFVLAYSFFISYLTVNLVAEKEKKIREGMFMMGLRNSVFWLSWSIVYFILILVVTSVVTLIAGLAQFLSNSNMFLFWLMLMMYGLSIIALAFLLTPFFKKARVAGVVASFTTIILSLIYLAVSQSRTITPNGYNYGVPPAAQWAMCLLSPVALALAMDKAIFLDVWRGGMTFETIDMGEFPLYAPLIMLALDIVLYFLLAVYLDHVIPGEYGVRYKPWYFLQKSYWFPRQSTEGERSHLVYNQERQNGPDVVSGPNIEPVAGNLRDKRTMRVTNITRSFKNKGETVTAVKNLSLDMYEGQITALLGHNGAGKTTLINMLTGVIPPTSGTASIRDLDVTCSGDMEEIRSMCGICPQHNILYDDLSAKEHLIIFAGVKGVPSNKVDVEVMRALKSVDLSDQADVLASKLSGGQKRKLSVAMALIGDPKIIFLDEPTAGMDPYSRRHLWSLLKSSKEGRLILLTTHFMDEADILADRKAIISKGQLKCCGSSLFLKSKFGIGYHLNMVVEPSCDRQSVTSLLGQHVVGVEFQRSHGKELSFTIPVSEVNKFANLFRALESDNGSMTVAKSLGILNYGVSMPTLEEVFLKLGDDEEKGEEEEEKEENSRGSDNPNFNGSLAFLNGDSTGRKREDSIHIEMRANRQDPSGVLHTLQEKGALTSARFWALVKLRILLLLRAKAAWIFLIVLPIGLVTGGLVISRQRPNVDTSSIRLNSVTYAQTPTGVKENQPNFAVKDIASNAISNSIVTHIQSFLKVDSLAASASLIDEAPHYLGASLLTTDTATNNLGSYTALYNDTAYHGLPAILNTLTEAVLLQAGSSEKITTYSYPWPGDNTEVFDNGAFSSSLMIGIAFVLIAPGFAIGVVQETQWKCKSQLRIAGVSFHMYWGTYFFVSIIVYLIPAVTCLIIALAMEVPSLTPAGAIVILILLFIVFIPQCLLLALMFTYFFEKYESAQAALPNMFTMGGMLPYLAVSLVDMLAAETAATAMHYILCFVDPVYIIFGGFYYIDKIYRINRYKGTDPTFGEYFSFDNNVIICVIACIIDFIAIYFLMRILEVRSNGGTVREALRFGDVNTVHNTPTTNSDPIEGEDEDVARERERVENLEHGALNTQDTVAYVQQTRKEFIKTGKAKKPCSKPEAKEIKVAVRNLSFAVNKGEVFGLLGPNGAGKTTALNMITGEVHPSQGSVVIAGQHVRSNMSDAFQSLGFCPQHDALWETIRLSEHIELYAAIKGVPKTDIPIIRDYLMENLKIDEHKSKNSKKLSGGTKRKLSYAMSMLGWPKVVLLDEPSTGMDPQSKRFLWDTISSSFEGQDRGAILTTHYMEEADALCTRVAIMVNGQMECLGPTQHLKTKYGSGYLLEVKIAGSSSASHEDLEEKVKNLEEHLLSLFPNATCLESFAERAQYKIPQSDVSVLSETFAALEGTKSTHDVEEYSFSQSTLEQVFLNFARKQMEEGENVDKSVLQRQLSHNVDPTHAEPYQRNNTINERL